MKNIFSQTISFYLRLHLFFFRFLPLGFMGVFIYIIIVYIFSSKINTNTFALIDHIPIRKSQSSDSLGILYQGGVLTLNHNTSTGQSRENIIVSNEIVYPYSFTGSPRNGSIDNFLTRLKSIHLIREPFPHPTPLSIDGSLTKTFSLSCLHYPKVSSYFCHQRLNHFLQQFWLYNIENHGKELGSLMDHLTHQEKLLFCQGLINHVDNYVILPEWFGSVIEHCGTAYKEKLIFFRDLMNRKKEFYSFITPVIYEYSEINHLKISTLIHIIIQGLTNENPPISLVETYLLTTEKLLLNDKINTQTMKIMLDFHQQLLSPFLNKNKPGLIEKIDFLNKHISSLLGEKNNITTPINLFSVQSDSSFYEYVSAIPGINIEKLEYTPYNQHAYVEGTFINQQLSIPLSFTLYKLNNIIYVKSFSVRDNDMMNKIISTHLTTNNFVSLYTLIEIIQETFSLDSKNIDVCDHLSQNETIGLQNVHILDCDNSSIIIKKDEITYHITYNSLQGGISTSDDQLTKILQQDFHDTIFTSDTVISIILKALNTTITQETPQTTLSNLGLIESIFTPIFGVAPNEIFLSGGDYHVVFSTHGYYYQGRIFSADLGWWIDIYMYQKEGTKEKVFLEKNIFSLNREKKFLIQRFLDSNK